MLYTPKRTDCKRRAARAGYGGSLSLSLFLSLSFSLPLALSLSRSLALSLSNFSPLPPLTHPQGWRRPQIPTCQS